MKLKKFLCLLTSALITASAFPLQASAAEKSTVGVDENFAEDRVIVKLADNSYSQNMSEITDKSFGISCSKVRLLNPSKTVTLNNEGKYSAADITDTQNNVFVLTLKDTGTDAVENALKILNDNPAVEIAEPDYFRESTATPNDPRFDLQYALKNIDAETAWDYAKGDGSVVVGIIDSGIEGTHPDLIDNLWVNPNPNQNGYVDDIHGYNFYKGVGGTPTDGSGHGTHVSGIIGAKGNNGIGVSGVNWNVSLAWLGAGIDDTRYLSDSAIIEAINYANLHDISITNNSWGSTSYSETLKEAIENFKGLFVVAAGNDSTNTDNTSYYPACYDLPNIISVASTDSSDQLSYFSNYGSETVDIAAPGTDVYSTYPNSGYQYLSGTSMATPNVTGVAALLKSAHPDLTTAQLKSAILNGYDHLEQLDGLVANGRRLNAYKALQAVHTGTDVYFQNTNNWSDVKVYYWSTLGATPVNWPGESMTRVYGDIYKANIPSNCNKVIFSNNGSDQTADLTVPGDNYIYNPSSATWTEYNPGETITIYFQNDFNWNDPRAYYWENNGGSDFVTWPGESMTKVSGNTYKASIPANCNRVIFNNNGSDQTVDLSIPGDNYIYNPSSNKWTEYNPGEMITIYFQNDYNWNDPKAYYWENNGSSDFVTWPGESMTKVSGNTYKVSIPANCNRVIFNNNGSDQTADLSIPGDNYIYNPSSNKWTEYNPSGTITIYFQNDYNWNSPKAYYWESSTDYHPVAWPGESMTQVKGNVYKVDVPSTCDRVIFSDNGSYQTANLIIPGDGKIYSPSTGTWENYNPNTDNVTLYFTNNNNWSNLKAYLWNSVSNENNTWPGAEMSYVGVNEYNQSIYSITFDSKLYDRVIFNGSEGQTVDITVGPDGTGYYLTGKEVDGKWEVASYSYK